MDDAALQGRAKEGNHAFFAMVATRVHEAPGVQAVIVPRCPDRSVFNCVFYDDPASLAAALDEVAGVYHEAGVFAWTVWVPHDDREAAGLLARAGHKLDGSPALMGAQLEALELDPADGIDWEEAPIHAAVGPLNDLAYGYEGSFTAALEAMAADPRARTYVAGRDGEPASCLMTLDHGSDCHVGLVATAPAAQRKGLAGRLLAQALRDARDRGLETTTLIASRAGYPVYQRLGYRPVGEIEMWERRSAPG